MKKAVSMFLALMLVVASLTACGSTDNGATDNGSGTQDSGETTEATEEDTTEVADNGSEAGETFHIGGIGPLTGAVASYGIGVKNGAQIAIDEINAAGGINGYQIDYNYQDDEHDQEKAINAYNTLKDWGMQMLMGTVTSAPCIAVAAETASDQMFQITPSGSSPDAVVQDNVFQICFSDPNQGQASAQYIAENNLTTKAAVIYDSSDPYSTGIYESFATEAKAQGIDIVEVQAFTGDNNKDFSVQLQAAQQAEADLVFLPIYYLEATLILQQANTMAYDVTFFGCDGLDGILSSVEGFDISLAEDVMLLTPFSADEEAEATQAFVTKYQEAHKEIPNQFAADAYDAIYAIKAAAEAGNVTPDMSIAEMCEAMKTAMTQIELNGLTSVDGTPMVWSEDGTVNKAPKAVIIENGAYKAM